MQLIYALDLKTETKWQPLSSKTPSRRFQILQGCYLTLELSSGYRGTKIFPIPVYKYKEYPILCILIEFEIS